MGFQIENGVGDNASLLVDKNNRAHTLAVTQPSSIDALLDGGAYNINTGLISMSANGTLIYFKSDEDQDILVETLVIGSFEGVTHSDDPYVTIIANPTGGDLISDTSAVAQNANRNFSSSKTLKTTTLAYKGKSSGTITGGTEVAILQVNPAARNAYPINFLIQKGGEFAAKLTLNASGGSANYYAALILYAINDENKR